MTHTTMNTSTRILLILAVTVFAVLFFWFFLINGEEGKQGNLPIEPFPSFYPFGGDRNPGAATTTNTATTTIHLYSTPAERVNAEVLMKTFHNDGSGSYTYDSYPKFVITFFEPDNSLHISLNAQPYSETRKEVEDFLLSTTQRTKEDLCEADINIAYKIDHPPFWQPVGLSFCEGSLPL